MHPYALPLIREAVKLGCIPTSLETVSFSLSLSLSRLRSSSPLPSKAFFWGGRTANVALLGSHHLCAALFLPLPVVEAAVYYVFFGFSLPPPPDENVEAGSEISQALTPGA